MEREATNWIAVSVVQQHVQAAADAVARFAAASFREYMEHQLGPDDDREAVWRLGLESPLEAIFYVWWKALVGEEGWIGKTFRLNTQQDVDVAGARYRLDFVIELWPEGMRALEARRLQWPSIAVEVDGHGFHEKTPEQVAKRNQRDRLLQNAGWLVLHYSWSEMTTRPEQCIGEVVGVLKERYWSLVQHPHVADGAATNEVGAATRQES